MDVLEFKQIDLFMNVLEPSRVVFVLMQFNRNDGEILQEDS